MHELSVFVVLGFAVIVAVFPTLRNSGFFLPSGYSGPQGESVRLSAGPVPDAHYPATIPVCPQIPPQDLSRNGASPFVFRFYTPRSEQFPNLPLSCYGPSILNLINYLNYNPDMLVALNASRALAVNSNVYGYPPLRDMNDMINFIQFDVINWIPLENQQLEHINASKSMYIRLTQYYYLFNQGPILTYQSTITPHQGGEMPWLSIWMRDLTNEWGAFLNDDASFPPIAMEYMWESDKSSRDNGYPLSKQFKLNNYMPPAGGYHSYQQWFARAVRPGFRPVDNPGNDAVMVAPCDSTWVNQWGIDSNGCIGLTDAQINGDDNYNSPPKTEEKKPRQRLHKKLKGAFQVGNPESHKKRYRSRTKSVDQCQSSTVTARPMLKGVTYYSIQTLIRDAIAFNESWRHAFDGGTFMHMFLNVNDYHRLHVPVRGRVLYNGFTSENVYLRVCVLPESQDQYVPGGVGSQNPNYCPGYVQSGLGRTDSMSTHGVSAAEFNQVDPTDLTGYQFYQSRGTIIIDSPIGLVAAIPMGMAQVSLVNTTAVPGTCVRKGDEFSYFGIGGSDMIVLVQKNANFVHTGGPNHLDQGQALGLATVDPAASARLGNCGSTTW